MIEKTDVKHKVKKHILSILVHQKTARFRDMRPPRVDANLYSYHLGQLVKGRYIRKMDNAYTLDTIGLIYASRIGTEKPSDLQLQTKVLFVIQNSDGGILLQKVARQPHINQWSLPSGDVQITDSSVLSSAQRIMFDQLKMFQDDIRHAGDCYVRVHYGDTPLSVMLAHVFAFETDDIGTTDQLQWVRPHKLQTIDLVPGTEEIIARTFFRDPFYFEDYSFEW